MNSLDWNQIGVAFDHLAGLATADRDSQLENIRLENPAFAAELLSLLTAHDAADGFIENRVQRILNSLAPAIELQPGEKLLHFEIVELLGSGSSAHVYLAKDTELGRLIALKITLSKNREASTLANFSAEGIVQVYSEHVIQRDGLDLRLICLQFVAGPTLAGLQKELRDQNGKSLVQILESFPQRKVSLDPAALKWRETLGSLSLGEAAILIGIRLAEILEHAHSANVLHLDIKPANILIDPFGRPYLSDFNVSTHRERLNSGDVQGMGGTPHYMPPEQQKFFENQDAASASNLDARTDVYALGVVIQDLAHAAGLTDPSLDKILARATANEKSERTESANQLAHQLRAWLRRYQAEREMPELWSGLNWVKTYPMLALVSLVFLSQILASVINISYNNLQIVSALTPEQIQAFLSFVPIYNLLTYPLMNLGAIYCLRSLVFNRWSVEQARKATLNVPCVVAVAISIGWLPGTFCFPYFIEKLSGELSPSIYWQFAGSFTLAWVTSLTTSVAVSIFVVARALYPKYWQGESDVAARELKSIEFVNRTLPFVSALIPMSGALLVVLLAQRDLYRSDDGSFQILLLVIVGFGLTNLLFVQQASRYVEKVVNTLKRPRTFD